MSSAANERGTQVDASTRWAGAMAVVVTVKVSRGEIMVMEAPPASRDREGDAGDRDAHCAS